MRSPAAVVLVLSLVATACTGGGPDGRVALPDAIGGATDPSPAPDGAVATVVPDRGDGAVTGADGNRFRPGSFVLADAPSVVVDLPSPATWVVSVPGADAWAVVSADGAVREVGIDGSIRRTLTEPGRHDPGVPPTVIVEAGATVVETALDTGAIGVWDDGVFRVEVRDDGRASLLHETFAEGFLVGDVLPDARPVRASDRRVALLTGPTDAYPHGVLGDEIEASAISVWALGGRGRTVDPVEVFRVASDEVIEDLAPVVADVDGDGATDFVVTVSDADDGGRVVMLGSSGRRDGPAVGRGNRWIHVLGVAPTGTDGAVEIVAVQTPHLGGRLQFLRPTDAGRLDVVATADGHRSHRIGSRNLSMAVLIDASGDGRPDAVVPDDDADGLVVVGRVAPGGDATGDEGIVVHARVDLGAAIATNVVTMVRDDRVFLAVGTDDGHLHLFG